MSKIFCAQGTVKALTVLQPWAHLIAHEDKRIENRKWYTHFRGWLAIHSGKSDKLCEAADFLAGPDMSFGKIVAIARVIECVKLVRFPAVYEGPKKYRWIMANKWAEGPYCWIFEEVITLPNPIAARGRQGFWNWQATEDQANEIREIRIKNSKSPCQEKGN